MPAVTSCCLPKGKMFAHFFDSVEKSPPKQLVHSVGVVCIGMLSSENVKSILRSSIHCCYLMSCHDSVD